MFKKIEAIIRPEMVEDVKNALFTIGIVGFNVTDVRGHGRDGGIELSGRSGTYKIDLLPKSQLNIVLSERNVEKAVLAIRETARTGNRGDGVIFIYPVEDVIRIRTGQRGQQALYYEGDIDDRKKKSS
jgi:nitrogen regulatory protein P-II 1